MGLRASSGSSLGITTFPGRWGGDHLYAENAEFCCTRPVRFDVQPGCHRSPAADVCTYSRRSTRDLADAGQPDAACDNARSGCPNRPDCPGSGTARQTNPGTAEPSQSAAQSCSAGAIHCPAVDSVRHPNAASDDTARSPEPAGNGSAPDPDNAALHAAARFPGGTSHHQPIPTRQRNSAANAVTQLSLLGAGSFSPPRSGKWPCNPDNCWRTAELVRGRRHRVRGESCLEPR